jgi:hypothetical protein
MSYSKDFRKLRSFANEYNFSVRFIGKKSLSKDITGAIGLYRVTTRTIWLSRTISNRPHILLYTLAHELGHALHFDLMSKKELKTRLACSGLFNAWTRGEVILSKSNISYLCQAVMSGEEIACDYGDIIIRDLGLKLPQRTMERERNNGLQAYEDLFSRFVQ